ncbi:hypothetical protein SLEP1_g2642 [Rubroshorea leprosula]|uniref:65-kDa microtubule-associated protein 3-like n=1 Tax=Rubroshorea leprosula TaxID=152421 RepID=A0AAV5HQ46_9ROSI|nr:hypothetical protein SLEP1_g2642 [Rubroshorea leprosula]
MSNHYSDQFAHIETTCGSLLCELKKIWDEVGEPEDDRDTMLLQIEQECLRIYMRKVDGAKKCRAKLQREVEVAEKEISDISASLGVKPVNRDRKPGGNLREELQTIVPLLEDMRRQKVERKNQFVEVLDQLRKISNEIFGLREDICYDVDAYGTNMSVHRLEELRRELRELQNEKITRLNQVQDHLNNLKSLCLVLDIDFKETVCKIHPNLDDSKGTKDVSDGTIARLAAKIQSMRDVKIQRMLKLQDLAASLLELWHLMDTPVVEQQMFQNVTSQIAASEPEIIEPGMLSMKNIKNVEVEESRLEQLKVSRMKEFVLKKQVELEDICKKTHMVAEPLHSIDYSMKAMETGALDPMYLIEQIELQISKVKEEALSRKEILEKVEKWLSACEEESWLEEYNRDDNRYNAGRGAHLALKRAEKARAMVNKIPAMVEALISKTEAWEIEHGTVFLYDGAQLISILEQYSSLRQEKEQEKQRQRDQKRLQGQLMAEQEARYGSKPSPSKSGKKVSRTSEAVANNRKFSLGGALLQHPKPENPAIHLHSSKKGEYLNRKSSLAHQQTNGFATHSARRNSEIPGQSVKKPISSAPNAYEVASPVIRKPLSPVSFPVSSNTNIPNIQDQKTVHNGQSKVAARCKTPMGTPATGMSAYRGDEENRTPKTVPIPVPTTPSTVSAPMLMAVTPASPVSFGAKKADNTLKEVEYSFEEVRAGFLYPISHS